MKTGFHAFALQIQTCTATQWDLASARWVPWEDKIDKVGWCKLNPVDPYA